MRRLVQMAQILFIVLIGLSLPAPSLAQQESCKKCEYVKCIKNTIKQKEALRAGYEALARKWEKVWVDANGPAPVPLNTVEMEKLQLSSRIPTFAMLRTHFLILRNQEEEMASQVGAPQGCGYDPSKNYEMETDSIFCNIDRLKSSQAEQSAPCRELYEIALRHEVLHLTKCQFRKGDKKLPTVVMTPAGKAREEMEAYTQEIAELKKLLEDMEGNSLEMEGRNEMTVPIVGTVVITLKGKAKFTVSEDPAQTISGSGETSVQADTSRLKCQFHGYNKTLTYKIGGNRSGDTMNFKVIPTGSQELAGFRVTCPSLRGYGFALPVPKMTGDLSIAANDGEKIVIPIPPIAGGYVKGENSLTLHLCKEKNEN